MAEQEVTEFELPGYFRITAPTTWVRDSGTSAVLRLYSPQLMGSGLAIDCATVVWKAQDSERLLMEITNQYVNETIPATDHRRIHTAHTATAIDGRSDSAVTKILMENDHAWLLKIVVDLTRQLLYVLQYNGPQEEMTDGLLRIFDSFEVLDVESSRKRGRS